MPLLDDAHEAVRLRASAGYLSIQFARNVQTTTREKRTDRAQVPVPPLVRREAIEQSRPARADQILLAASFARVRAVP
jgi:hypothetical protein